MCMHVFGLGGAVGSRRVHLVGWLLILGALGFGLCNSQGAPADVLTYRNDGLRTGSALYETVLKPANCNSNQFGQLFAQSVDGFLYAQPLYMGGVSIPGRGIHNVVFVATEHDSVYAFDADDDQGANAGPLWQTSFIHPEAGITTQPIGDYGLSDLPATEFGITGTPVIDPDAGVLYVVAKIKDASTAVLKHRQLLYALDIHTGAAVLGSPVEITAVAAGTGTGSDDAHQIVFDPYYEFQRCGLTLVNGVVYVAFASHGDLGPYHGWVLGYDARTLRQVGVFNDTPDGDEGGIWMSGGAPAFDAAGNLYFSTGNGSFNANLGQHDFGDSVVKLSTGSGKLEAVDFFTPYNQETLDAIDGDLGSGGVLLLPDEAGSPAHPHLAVTGGKDGMIYLLDRDQLGHFSTNITGAALQAIPNGSKIFGTPAYFGGRIYFSGVGAVVKAYRISGGRMDPVPESVGPIRLGYPGSIPSVSANGAADGILWTIQASGFGSLAPAVLRAYDAVDLRVELYNSEMSGGRDHLGLAQKFSVPTVAAGKVYVGTGGQLAVLGLFPPTHLTVASDAGGTQLAITVEGEPGRTYALQAADTFDDPDQFWYSITTVTLQSARRSLTAPIPDENGRRFFRAVRLE